MSKIQNESKSQRCEGAGVTKKSCLSICQRYNPDFYREKVNHKIPKYFERII